MNNIRDLELELCTVFEQLKKDPKRVCQAKELANLAGKIIGTQKISMEYADLCKTQVTLPFMQR